MTVAIVDDLRAVRGEDGAAAFSQVCDSARAHIHEHNLLPRAGCVTGRIRYFAALILLTTAHVSDRVRRRRENQIAQFLSIVTVIMG